MSLFQCDHCGCCENTALSGYHSQLREWKRMETDHPAILASYRVVLGLKEDQPLGQYCSACSPVWEDQDGKYGLGPNPNPIPGHGMWHGQFKRSYYPKGKFWMDEDGNLRHVASGDPEIEKWRLEEEDPEPAPIRVVP